MRDICVNYTTAAGVRSREQGAGSWELGSGGRRREWPPLGATHAHN